ncbi:DUF2627 domain-containing protein [Paenibacillus sp. HB172176]|uniref:DUF2627 domain-containing protein n=1 Tax=Paenibacillus sp. HB172176 TaxID=2493690 RepID=UPI00143B4A22|nr:DUF2627 domain-containing protein [Paenibacillus sp. HB172176]
MRMIMSRFIAVLLLVIPGVIACIGFLKMKDSVFNYFSEFGDDTITPDFHWLTFLLGLLMFAVGVGFIGGWTFFRDRKRNYVAPRFKEKRPRPPKPQG